jgi:putative cardiolipin synthase
MGLVLGNPVLALGLTRFFDVEVPTLAYEVRLSADGKGLEWIERSASGEKHYDTDPETSWSTRMGVELLSILPIEWLL